MPPSLALVRAPVPLPTSTPSPTIETNTASLIAAIYKELHYISPLGQKERLKKIPADLPASRDGNCDKKTAELIDAANLGLSRKGRITRILQASASIPTGNNDQVMPTRPAECLRQLGPAAYSICLFSAVFRRAEKDLDVPLWRALLSTLSKNVTSLVMFGQVRGLQPDGDEDPVPPELFNLLYHPHERYITRDNRIEDTSAINYDSCFYDPRKFFHPAPPPKAHPTITYSFDAGVPLLELWEKDPTSLGRNRLGVRSLRRFQAGQCIGVCTGDLVPAPHEEALKQGRYKLVRESNSLFAIDQAIRGNWTRYIRHSEHPSAYFSVGFGSVLHVVAFRDIALFEEVTADMTVHWYL